MIESYVSARAPRRGPLGVGIAVAALVMILVASACGRGSDRGPGSETPPPGKVALDAESQAVAKNIQANMKDFLITNKVPAGAKVTLNWVRATPMEGLYEANFGIAMGSNQGRRSIYFDQKAKHFVLGPVYTVGQILRSRIETKNMVLLDRASKGPESAPIVIVEYTDFECPYCAAAAGTLRALLKKYNNQVRLVVKHMPLDQMHPWAYDAAVTAECAAAQKPEAFWYFYDYFFDPTRRLTKENIGEKTQGFAKSIGLDVDRLKSCVEKKEPKTRIDSDLKEATDYGFTATPTFVINGVVVVGNHPLSVFEEVIQEQLLLLKAGEAKG